MSKLVLEKSNMLPEKWIETSLDQISDIILGQSPPSSTYNKEKDGLPFFQGKSEFGILYPTPKIWCNKPKKLAEKNDVLLSVRAPVGTTNLCPEKSCIGRGLAAIRPKGDIPVRFILYFLRHIEHDLERQGSGTTFKAISGNQIKSITVPLPPLNEQKRIVSKIEELFSKIEYSIENLQKTRLQLNEYKQSILKNAFNGSLTMNWRKKHGSQLEKVTEILKKVIENKHGFDDNYLNPLSQDVKILPKLPSQWVWTTIGLVSESMKNGIYKPKSSYSNKGIACLRMYNIEDGELVWKNIKRMNLSQKEISEYELLPNDLLVNRVNSRELVGKTARIPEGVERCVYESKNIRLRLFRNFTNSNLVAYWFKLFRQTFFNRNAQQTVGMASINQEQLSQMPIPYMHISEQNELVKQIEFHFTIVKNSLSLIEVNLKHLDKLRNSVLKQAFEGKLVPQDPNDEPVEILLQKIKQEKETLQKKQKVNKVKSRRIKNAK